jgi:hypothetical protein
MKQRCSRGWSGKDISAVVLQIDGLSNPVIQRPDNKFCQGMCIGLEVYMPEMGIHSMNGKLQLTGDRFPALGLGDQ